MRHVDLSLCSKKALVLALLLGFFQTTYGDAFNDAKVAFEKGDYATALQVFRSLAKQDDARGQNGLGIIYLQGLGVPQDYNAAFQWFQKAAEQDYAAAQYNLARAYERGQGVKPDQKNSVKWYRKAAENGHAEAQYSLGLIHIMLRYFQGRGDLDEAYKWTRKAAEQGHRGAMQELAMLYNLGWGVEQDNIQAYAWCHLVLTSLGDDRARMTVEMTCDEVVQTLATEEVLEAQDMAKQLADKYNFPMPSVTESKDTESLNKRLWESVLIGDVEQVTRLIDQGAEVDARDWEEKTPLHQASLYGRVHIVKELIARGADVNAQDEHGFTPLSRAARNGHIEVVNVLIDSGADVEKSSPNPLVIATPLSIAITVGDVKVVKALIEAGANVKGSHLISASFDGHTEIVKILIANGVDVDKKDRMGNTAMSTAKARGHSQIVRLLEKAGAMEAAIEKQRQAAVESARLARVQAAIKKNRRTIIQAAKSGDVEAQYELGRLYLYGEGVSQDTNEGLKWYRKAAEQGYSIASRTLGHMYFRGAWVEKDIAEAAKWYFLALDQGDSTVEEQLEIIERKYPAIWTRMKEQQ